MTKRKKYDDIASQRRQIKRMAKKVAKKIEDQIPITIGKITIFVNKLKVEKLGKEAIIEEYLNR